MSKAGILISGIATAILWLVSFYGLSIGNFVIQVNESKATGKGISLSANEDFSSPTTRLETVSLKRTDNITYSDIPNNVVDKLGNNNDPNGNYFAFSFYIKNTGDVTIDYTAMIRIDDVSKSADSAIRVMVVKDLGEKKVYAKPQEQGPNIGEPEMGTYPFMNNKTVYFEEMKNFKKDAITRYGIVIWLEGSDPECIDDIKGGGVRLSMHFKIVE